MSEHKASHVWNLLGTLLLYTLHYLRVHTHEHRLTYIMVLGKIAVHKILEASIYKHFMEVAAPSSGKGHRKSMSGGSRHL